MTSAAGDTGVDRVTRGKWTTLVAMTIAAGRRRVDQTAVPQSVPRAVNDLALHALTAAFAADHAIGGEIAAD